MDERKLVIVDATYNQVTHIYYTKFWTQFTNISKTTTNKQPKPKQLQNGMSGRGHTSVIFWWQIKSFLSVYSIKRMLTFGSFWFFYYLYFVWPSRFSLRSFISTWWYKIYSNSMEVIQIYSNSMDLLVLRPIYSWMEGLISIIIFFVFISWLNSGLAWRSMKSYAMCEKFP